MRTTATVSVGVAAAAGTWPAGAVGWSVGGGVPPDASVGVAAPVVGATSMPTPGRSCLNAFGLLMSLNMLIETPGGFDYTVADCCGWLREAGFRESYVEHLVGPESMIVGIK